MSRSTIFFFFNNKQKIAETLFHHKKTTFKNRKSTLFESDAALLSFFLILCLKNEPIIGLVIHKKADQLSKAHSSSNFKCISGWIDRFRKQLSITSGVIPGSIKRMIIDDWCANDYPKIKKEYRDEDIFNADEPGLFLKVLTNKTFKFTVE